MNFFRGLAIRRTILQKQRLVFLSFGEDKHSTFLRVVAGDR